MFRSGGSKLSAKEPTEQPKGRPVTLAPLVPPQPQTMPPLFTREQMKEARAAAVSHLRCLERHHLYRPLKSSWSSFNGLLSFKKKKKDLKEEEEERRGVKEVTRRKKAKSLGDVMMKIQKILEAATEVAFKKKKKKRLCGAGRSRRI